MSFPQERDIRLRNVSNNSNESPHVSLKVHNFDEKRTTATPTKLRNPTCTTNVEFSPKLNTSTFEKFINGNANSDEETKAIRVSDASDLSLSDVDAHERIFDSSSEPHEESSAMPKMPKTLAALLKNTVSRKAPRNPSYDVSFARGPIGLELETDWYGRQAVVKGFKKIDNADGPAKLCGLIHIGDVLTSINGKSCLEQSFQETLKLLREVGHGEHTLHFKTLEAVGDLSAYSGDCEISEARRYIHLHKAHYYCAPEDSEMIYGCIERHRGPYVTSFNFHKEDTGEFVLACSCESDHGGNFVFHTIQDSHLREMKDIPQNSDSAVYLGTMRPNFLGTEFVIKDHRSSDGLILGGNAPKDLALVTYETNVLGRVPNFLKAIIPRAAHHTNHEEANRLSTTISDRYKLLKQTRRVGSILDRLKSLSFDDIRDAISDEPSPYGRSSSEILPPTLAHSFSPEMDERLSYGAVEQEDHSDLLVFQTKKPSWNENLCAWTLNFNGRVNQASKKNFLIVAEVGNDRMEEEFGEEKIFLRFGKMSKTRFTLDFRAPLSPLVAVGIACTTFAKKLAVT